MQYEKVVTNLILNKQQDSRFSFPAYIAKSDDQQQGALAPYYSLEENDKTEGRQTDYFWKGIPIGIIRDAMGHENKDISKSLIEESVLHIPLQNHVIDVYMYRPFHNMESLPCIVYFHGGAYVGGSYKVSANLCRALSDRDNIVVVNVDYRLAPEYPFPCGMDDCWMVLDWLYKHASKYHIKEQDISVAGDSAGGNFAIQCCRKDSQLGISRIKGCILYYPHVSMIETQQYPWSLEMYTIGLKDKIEIIKNMLGLKEIVRLSELYYLQERITKDSIEVSPLLCDDISWMPPTFIVTAEFDYLRIQQEYFAMKLYEAGVRVKMIQYQGMQHAFMDDIGIYPQAEATIVETCVSRKDK